MTGGPSFSRASKGVVDEATPPERAEQMVLQEGEAPEVFTWYRVDHAVGNVRNQGAHLIEPQSAS